MLYYAITVQEGIITGKHESAALISKDTFTGTEYAGQEVINLPGDIQVQSGHNIEEYTADWELKSIAQRVAEGYILLEEGYILDGEKVRPMTQEERISAGFETPLSEPNTEEITLMQINKLKAELAETDYRIIKCYEYSLIGLPLPYDISKLHNERQAMRDEIKTLSNR